MTLVNLHEGWTLRPVGGPLPAGLTGEPLPATVPGCVHTDLLRAGLIDELHLAITPVLLGRGEHLFQGIDLPALGYRCVQSAASDKATHVLLRRRGATEPGDTA